MRNAKRESSQEQHLLRMVPNAGKFLVLLLAAALFGFYPLAQQLHRSFIVQCQCGNATTGTARHAPDNPQPQHRETKCTKPRQHIVYTKIQKTGSGTIKLSILEPYGIKNNLVFLQYSPTVSNGLNYPYNVVPELIQPSIRGHYDMMISESRYKPEILSRLMPKDSFYFFSARHPVSRFLSAFYFSGINTKVGKTLGIRDPFRILEEFLKYPKDHLEIIAMREKVKAKQLMMVMKNQQLYDLGFDEEEMNSSDLESKIDQVISEFDTVVITEYFNESMVLLRRKLCWQLEDMIYAKEHLNTEYKLRASDLSKELVEKILEYNSADQILYEKAKKRFNEMIRREREFEKEVQLFKEMLEKTAEDCKSPTGFKNPKCPKPLQETFKIRQYYRKKQIEKVLRYKTNDIRRKLKLTSASP